MATNDQYVRWAEDAELLAHLGRALFAQETRVKVRLRRELPDRAVASWEEDDEDGDLPPETAEQTLTRHRAGTVGLIGLSIQQDGRIEGDEVEVELDAWFVGDALQAADDAGLLADVIPRKRPNATER